MGGKGSGRRGRLPFDEALAINELLQYSITTLKRVLLSPDVSEDRKAQIALVLASRRVSNKIETTHKIELTTQEQAIIDKYAKPVCVEAQVITQALPLLGTSSENAETMAGNSDVGG